LFAERLLAAGHFGLRKVIDFGVFIQSTRNPFELSIFRQAGEGIVVMAAAAEVDKVILGAYMTPSVSVKRLNIFSSMDCICFV
jgi:hypothetical protein